MVQPYLNLGRVSNAVFVAAQCSLEAVLESGSGIRYAESIDNGGAA